MKQATLVLPGPVTARTGGSIYDRRIVEGLRTRGWRVTVVELDQIVNPLEPPPTETAGREFAAIPDGSLVLVDGLSFGTIPGTIEQEGQRLRFVPIVHMVLSATPGLTRRDSATLTEQEARALTRARHVVVTGRPSLPHVRAMLRHQDDSFVTWIAPGVDRVDLRDRERADGPVRLLCVANVTPGKGHDILLRALSTLHTPDWTLRCAGTPTRDPEFAAYVHAMTRQPGLTGRVVWLGELGEAALRQEYESADLFVLPTRSESYGMAVAEAIAHGLPVVSTRTGEIPAITGDGALLVECGDEAAFAAAVARAAVDPTLRRSLAVGARRAAAALPTWDAAAAAMERVLIEVSQRG